MLDVLPRFSHIISTLMNTLATHIMMMPMCMPVRVDVVRRRPVR